MILDQYGNLVGEGPSAVADEPYTPVAPDSPEQIAEWQAELDKMSEGVERLTSLKIVWMPGDWWPGARVNRYYIYQMYPEGAFPFGVSEEELRGPDPRSYAGDYDRILGRFITIKPLTIDRHQWRLFQETGRFGSPYWVVQGEGGGHLRHWNKIQTQLAYLETGEKDTHPPAPGSLPFARPDSRTWDALRELDELVKWEGLVAFHMRAPHMIQEAERGKAAAYRERLWRHMKNQQEAIWSDEGSVLRMVKDAAPHGLGAQKGPDYEAIEQRFMEE